MTEELTLGQRAHRFIVEIQGMTFGSRVNVAEEILRQVEAEAYERAAKKADNAKRRWKGYLNDAAHNGNSGFLHGTVIDECQRIATDIRSLKEEGK